MTVTPDTVLRWHRHPPRRRRAAKSQRQRPGRRAGQARSGPVPALPGRSHRGCRLFTVDLLNGTTAYVLVVIEHASRRVRAFGQAAPRKPLPGAVADLDAFRARRRDLIGGVIREYAQVA